MVQLCSSLDGSVSKDWSLFNLPCFLTKVIKGLRTVGTVRIIILSELIDILHMFILKDPTHQSAVRKWLVPLLLSDMATQATMPSQLEKDTLLRHKLKIPHSLLPHPKFQSL